MKRSTQLVSGNDIIKKRIDLLKMAFEAGFKMDNHTLSLAEASEQFWHERQTAPFRKAEPKVMVAFQAGFEMDYSIDADLNSLFESMLYEEFPNEARGYRLLKPFGFPDGQVIDLSAKIIQSFPREVGQSDDHYEFCQLAERWKHCSSFGPDMFPKEYRAVNNSDLADRLRELLIEHPEYGEEFKIYLLNLRIDKP